MSIVFEDLRSLERFCTKNILVELNSIDFNLFIEIVRLYVVW